MINVVIADDHPVLRQGIKQQLRLEPDIRVLGEAKDGPTLSAVLAKSPPDVLLLDLRMRNFCAVEAVPRFQERYPRMRILIVTGYDDESHVQEMVKCNVDGYMVKDERSNAYARAIRDVHAGDGFYSNQIVSKALEQKEIELSTREKQVLVMIALGDSSKTIGEKLALSKKTVDTYVTRVFDKLGARNRANALAKAIKLGLVDVSELEWDDWD